MVLPLAHLVCLLAMAAEPRPLPLVITDLGSPDYALREAATEELARTPVYRLSNFEAALKDPNLTAEQRMRLDGAAFRAFADSPRGALGVQFVQAVSTAQVESVRKEFPAAAVLKPGDVITEIDGKPVSSRISADGGWSTVRSIIVSHDPGDDVPIVVQRNGAAVPLTVKLGDFTGLGPATAIYSYELHAAWQNRLERTTGRVEPVAIDATSLRARRDNVWSNSGPIDIVDAVSAARANSGEVPSVAAGASPDQARQIDRAEQAMLGGNPGGAGFARAFGNNGFVIGGRGAGMGITNDPRDLAKLSDKELATDRLRLTQWLQSFAMIAGQQEINRGQRKQFVDMQNQTLQQLNALSREIDRRKAARMDAGLNLPGGPVPVAPPPVPEKEP